VRAGWWTATCLAVTAAAFLAATALAQTAGNPRPAVHPAPQAGVARGQAGEGAPLLEAVRANRRALLTAQFDTGPRSGPSKTLAEAVRRLQEALRRPPTPPQAVAAPEAPTGEPSAAPSARTAPATPARPTARPRRPPFSAEDLKRLAEDAPKNPSAALLLADALYLGGHLAEAVPLYQRLLAQPTLPEADRAWTLYQSANCKRLSDPAGAAALYERLLNEHPESPWAAAATVRKALAKWQAKVRPQTLLAGTVAVGAAAGRSAASQGPSPKAPEAERPTAEPPAPPVRAGGTPPSARGVGGPGAAAETASGPAPEKAQER